MIDIAVKQLNCKQKDLAKMLGVSSAQISKWKKGEYISHDMENKLSELAGIGGLIPDFVYLSNGIENANKWENLICHIADVAIDMSETGYDSAPLSDERELLCFSVFDTITSAGLEIPNSFPKDLDLDYDDGEWLEKSTENVIGNTIFELLQSLDDVYGFYAAYISPLCDGNNEEILEIDGELYSGLIELALCKISPETSKLLPKFDHTRFETLGWYEKKLRRLRVLAYEEGKPLKTEILDLVALDHESLSVEAEREALGINNSRLHPDVYMDEILKSHRIIHQVLPLICKKLGITDEELREVIDLKEPRLKI
ncbi:helix-turn-helix domain-containing protein [Enterovibrio baiacu]|uniref:helix-turn-helix domain-containing protein n=1 Tax=Enterovibrio baiacu TaxID=2491023 RepID=UPI003D140195